MGMFCQPDAIKRAAAMFLIVAVAVMPLVHTGHTSAQTTSDSASDMCCIDPCGCCDTEPGDEQAPCTPDENQTPCNDDRPCDCPCCGKVLTVVSMISPLPADAPFWGETPVMLPIPHDARPDTVAMRVDIQPPIA